MQTKEELSKLYSSFSDKKLLDIIKEKDQFTKNALEAAYEELKKRNLQTDQIQQEYSKQIDIDTDNEVSKSNKDLIIQENTRLHDIKCPEKINPKQINKKNNMEIIGKTFALGCLSPFIVILISLEIFVANDELFFRGWNALEEIIFAFIFWPAIGIGWIVWFIWIRRYIKNK